MVDIYNNNNNNVINDGASISGTSSYVNRITANTIGPKLWYVTF
jgi:hypothetical protein